MTANAGLGIVVTSFTRIPMMLNKRKPPSGKVQSNNIEKSSSLPKDNPNLLHYFNDIP